jgi:16S rRNA (adenine1518-N6/adenine1519-N6)-dimethyltransferase
MDPDQPARPAPPPSPRQTLSYLHSLLSKAGIRPKNKLGQNFLIDLNVLDLLVRTAELTPEDIAVEIGSGTGSLTARLAEAAGAVLSVEIDAPFHALTSELVGDRPNVRLLHADVLKNKNQLNPEVLTAVAELRRTHPGATLKLVANLPYAVATPVLANFLISDLPFRSFVVTVQWEIAERLMARPGTKDYGALAVLVQSLVDVTLVRKLAPSVFFPRPEVHSAIVRLDPDPGRRRQVGDVERFRVFLRDLYTHRRKNLRMALVSMPGSRRSKGEVDGMLAQLGVNGGVRAEQLTIADHLQLSEAFGGDSPHD